MREDELGGANSTHGEDVKCLIILVENFKGKVSLVSLRRRLEDNIKMDLK
jgi:hypothetical protein